MLRVRDCRGPVHERVRTEKPHPTACRVTGVAAGKGRVCFHGSYIAIAGSPGVDMNDEHQLPRLYVGNQTATAFSGASSDARWVFQTLLRRKLVILLPALLFAIIAAAVAVNVPNRYTATAMIRFDPRGEKSSHGDATASNMFDKESLNSQRELLQAQRMAQRVITQLDLVADAEFN